MKRKKGGKACAVAVMAACIALSLPLGVITTMDRKDNTAVSAFFTAASGNSVGEILLADDQLGGNLVRNARVITEDLAGDPRADELYSALKSLEDTYETFSRQAGKSSHSRKRADRLVETYNEFGGAMFHWFDVADDVLGDRKESYLTYIKFKDKFIMNHERLLRSRYNEEAQQYNELFREPMVKLAQQLGLVSPLLCFEQGE